MARHPHHPPYKCKQMTNPNLRILGFEMSVCEDHVEQWTETQPRDASRPDSSVASCSSHDGVGQPRMVTVRVKDVIDALVGRSANRPVWLNDFHDDPISITEDMFEVLVAYRTLRRAA